VHNVIHEPINTLRPLENVTHVVNLLAKNSAHFGKYRLLITNPLPLDSDFVELNGITNEDEALNSICNILATCRNLLTEDGSLWVLIGDRRKIHRRLMLPHRLVSKLSKMGFIFREDIVCVHKTSAANPNRTKPDRFENILFFSKNSRSFTNMDAVRIRGNEVREGKNKQPPLDMIQFKPLNRDEKAISRIVEIIHSASSSTPFESLPSTSDIAEAFGYDPEKYCPTCYRKFKRHATRKRIGEHRHYPIFAVCNPSGKNPGNYWEFTLDSIDTSIAHHELFRRIIMFATEEGDWILDPFHNLPRLENLCKELKPFAKVREVANWLIDIVPLRTKKASNESGSKSEIVENREKTFRKYFDDLSSWNLVSSRKTTGLKGNVTKY
jgi:hypothetical protein